MPEGWASEEPRDYFAEAERQMDPTFNLIEAVKAEMVRRGIPIPTEEELRQGRPGKDWNCGNPNCRACGSH
jgi:hypothetical protein